MKVAILAAILLTLSVFTSAASVIAKRRNLAQFALRNILEAASPIFGHYVNPSTQSKTADWMKTYPDSTLLVHMNLPGTHDAATWNYTQATQDALKPITDMNGVILFPPQFYRCQESPIISMLNSGIRVFDLRFAFDATNTDLVFYHGAALQSESATVEDLLFAIYHWLDNHPSEALITSFQYEGGTKKNAANNADVQRRMFDYLTSLAAQKYFVQTKGELGTLGQARGKITLFRRFSLDQLSSSYEDALPGLHFPPGLWNDNGPNISLIYNSAKNLTAYIEDFYETGGPIGSSAAFNIDLKYNTTVAHLEKASTEYPDSLFWTWASSEWNINIPPDFPRIMALGNGTDSTPLGGVNQRLLSYLQAARGKRVGIVMFDFFDSPGKLVEMMLGF